MRKVLVVEDDRFISAIFTLFLKDLGYEIVGRCKTGQEAIEACKQIGRASCRERVCVGV